MKIIAEIGWNHMGDMDLAKKMIVAAKESGADFAYADETLKIIKIRNIFLIKFI